MLKFSNKDIQELLKFFSSSIQKVTSLPPINGTPEGLVVLSDPSSPSSKGVYLYAAGTAIKLFPTSGATSGTITSETTVINNTTVITQPIAGGASIYIKKQVLIAGIPDSLEAFVTGAGKLSTCDAPFGNYPTFDGTKVYTIDIDGHVYQDCHFYATAGVVSGGSLTFSVAASLASGAQPPFYADIAIIAVPK